MLCNIHNILDPLCFYQPDLTTNLVLVMWDFATLVISAVSVPMVAHFHQSGTLGTHWWPLPPSWVVQVNQKPTSGSPNPLKRASE